MSLHMLVRETLEAVLLLKLEIFSYFLRRLMEILFLGNFLLRRLMGAIPLKIMFIKDDWMMNLHFFKLEMEFVTLCNYFIN